MRSWLLALVVAAISPRAAVAQPIGKKGAAEAFAEGQRAYGKGDYLNAARRFEAAWKLDPDPVYLFNVAQAYRLGNMCAKAVAFYDRFLAAVPNPPNLAKVQQYKVQAETCAAMQAPPTPPVITPPVTPPPPPPDDAIRVDPPMAIGEPKDTGKPMRMVGLGTAALGAVGIGLGIVFTRKVGDYEDQRAELCDGATQEMPCDWDDAKAANEADLKDKGDSAALKAWLGYSLGGAAIIGGIALYVLNRAPEQAPSALTVVPTEGGVFASGTFRF